MHGPATCIFWADLTPVSPQLSFSATSADLSSAERFPMFMRLPPSDAFQGQAMTPSSDLYKVRGYPTYLVLDTDGTIAYRGHSGTDIDAVVADLLAKAKAKGK